MHVAVYTFGLLSLQIIVHNIMLTVASWVEKVGGTGSSNFPTDSCKPSMGDIIGLPVLEF